MLPTDTPLGRLEIVETYEEQGYGGLLVCRTLAGQRYLAWLYMDSLEDREWLLVAVSKKRFKQIRSGGLSPRRAFMLPENGALMVLSADQSAAPLVGGLTVSSRLHSAPVAYYLAVEDLDAERLPDEGALAIPTDTAPRVHEEDLKRQMEREANQRHRDVFHMGLELPHRTRTEASIEFLGQSLIALNKSLEAASMAREGKTGTKGKAPVEIKKAVELSITRVGAACYGATMVSTFDGFQDLFEPSEAYRSIDKLIALIEAATDIERLASQLDMYGPRVTASLRRLFNTWASVGAGVHAELASPRREFRRTAMTPLQVSDAAKYLNSQERSKTVSITLAGELRQLDFDHYNFRFTHEDVSYKGVVDRDVMPAPDMEVFLQAQGGAIYQATLRQEYSILASTSEEKVRTFLVALKPTAFHETPRPIPKPKPKPSDDKKDEG